MTRLALAAVAILALGAAAPPGSAPPSVGERLEEAARAAEGFQGRLDGHWRVVSAGGRVWLRLQLTQTPGAAAIEGAFARPGRAPQPIAAITRRGPRLRIILDARGLLDLRQTAAGAWKGVLASPHRRRRVALQPDRS